MKKLLLLFFVLSSSTLAFADEITLKLNFLMEDKANPKMEYAYYNGEKKIPSRVVDIRKPFEVIEKTGDIPDGVVTFYDPKTNELTEYTYKNGQKNGECISYYLTGEKSGVQHYKNDELEGLQQGFQKNGTLTNEYIINHDGQPSVERKYYKNGKLKSEATYLIGKSFADNKTLTEKTYNENGNIISDLKAPDVTK